MSLRAQLVLYIFPYETLFILDKQKHQNIYEGQAARKYLPLITSCEVRFVEKSAPHNPYKYSFMYTQSRCMHKLFKFTQKFRENGFSVAFLCSQEF